jgi:hypothetical protein
MTPMAGIGANTALPDADNARQAASPNRLARGAFRTVLRTVDAVALLRRKMASSLGA